MARGCACLNFSRRRTVEERSRDDVRNLREHHSAEPEVRLRDHQFDPNEIFHVHHPYPAVADQKKDTLLMTEFNILHFVLDVLFGPRAKPPTNFDGLL